MSVCFELEHILPFDLVSILMLPGGISFEVVRILFGGIKEFAQLTLGSIFVLW